jgi:hypothetical protein
MSPSAVLPCRLVLSLCGLIGCRTPGTHRREARLLLIPRPRGALISGLAGGGHSCRVGRSDASGAACRSGPGPRRGLYFRRIHDLRHAAHLTDHPGLGHWVVAIRRRERLARRSSRTARDGHVRRLAFGQPCHPRVGLRRLHSSQWPPLADGAVLLPRNAIPSV